MYNRKYKSSILFKDLAVPIEIWPFVTNIVDCVHETLDESIITTDEIDTVIGVTITMISKT